jgi:hypothetical protein
MSVHPLLARLHSPSIAFYRHFNSMQVLMDIVPAAAIR